VTVTDAEARAMKPKVVFVDTDNRIVGTGGDPAEALPELGLLRGDDVYTGASTE
jgi:aspartate 1-decarboxylase